MANEIQMAGPASGTDSPRITRMPVPRVAPDADHRQLQDPEAADQPGSAVAGFRFADHLPDRLAAKQLRCQSGAAGLRPEAAVR